MSWAEVKKSINTNLSKALDTLITEKHATTDSNVDAKIQSLRDYIWREHDGTKGRIAELSTLMSTGGSVKVVKGVQRGFATASSSSEEGTSGTTVPLTLIDPNKSLVIIYFDTVYSEYRDYPLICIRYTLNADSLFVPYHTANETTFPPSYRTPAFSWQVIEFY